MDTQPTTDTQRGLETRSTPGLPQQQSVPFQCGRFDQSDLNILVSTDDEFFGHGSPPRSSTDRQVLIVFSLKNSFFAHCQADDSPVSIPFQTPPHLPVLAATQSSISCLSRRTSLPGEQSSSASTSHSTLHLPTMNGQTWNPDKGYTRKKHGRQRIAPVLRLLPWDGAFPTSGRERTATTVDSALLPYCPSHCFGSLHYVIYTISANNLARLLGGGMLHLKSCIRESADHRAESQIKKRDR